jgi:ABC-2 type transport system permease protein
MRHPFRASLVKDLLLVLRDPMQWSQGVVFFGLLGAYFANLHRLAGASVDPSWRIGVASLNLACTLLVFASLAVRFIFPQISLEGRRLWLLRLSPHGVRYLLAAKLALYGVLAVLIVEGLLWLSATRLALPPPIRMWLAVVGVVAALTIVGLAVGLGAWWMDPTAQDAARVVSSSAGALALVLQLAYVGTVVGVLVIVWSGWQASAKWPLMLATGALVAASAAAVGATVSLGVRRLIRFEGVL